MRKAEEPLQRIEKEVYSGYFSAFELLYERWISPATYKEITWMHVRRLAELSDGVKRKADELRRTIRKVSLDARRTTEIHETKQ